MIGMNDKVLICYGTRYGSAGEVSEHVAETLRNRGATADVIDLKKGKVTNLDTYDLIVVGSGIQMGKWTKEPLKFLKKNREILSRKKVALFVSCMSAAKPETCNQARRDYLDNIAAEFPDVTPISMGLFGGMIDSSRGNIMTKAIMQALAKSFVEEGEEVPERIDLRDWDQITLWAENLIHDPFEE
ncbi:MAG: nitric oxide synthase [Candidatus Thorarchaeota archaeon]|nr:MAG: nitric oxide synthase [Candidatus Thorarchaeota archaeon]